MQQLAMYQEIDLPRDQNQNDNPASSSSFYSSDPSSEFNQSDANGEAISSEEPEGNVNCVPEFEHKMCTQSSVSGSEENKEAAALLENNRPPKSEQKVNYST